MAVGGGASPSSKTDILMGVGGFRDGVAHAEVDIQNGQFLGGGQFVHSN